VLYVSTSVRGTLRTGHAHLPFDKPWTAAVQAQWVLAMQSASASLRSLHSWPGGQLASWLVGVTWHFVCESMRCSWWFDQCQWQACCRRERRWCRAVCRECSSTCLLGSFVAETHLALCQERCKQGLAEVCTNAHCCYDAGASSLNFQLLAQPLIVVAAQIDGMSACQQSGNVS
jgi:hypothetical protein